MPVIRAMHIGALALLAGGFAFPRFVLPPGALAQPERASLRGWLAGLRRWGLFAALLTWLAWLVLLAADLSGQPWDQAWRSPTLLVVLGQTRFGQVWLLRFGLMLLLSCSVCWRWRDRARTTRDPGLTETALAASVLVSQAATGHAAASSPWYAAADGVHVVAATLWIGSLAPLLMVLARARAGAPRWRAHAGAAARGFTRLGVAAVGALALTGVMNGAPMTGDLHALAVSGYGRLMAAKLLLFCAMLALAAANRFRFTPALARDQAEGDATLKGLWRNVAAELALGACIVAIVGMLVGSEPPAHRHDVDAPEHHRLDGASVAAPPPDDGALTAAAISTPSAVA